MFVIAASQYDAPAPARTPLGPVTEEGLGQGGPFGHFPDRAEPPSFIPVEICATPQQHSPLSLLEGSAQVGASPCCKGREDATPIIHIAQRCSIDRLHVPAEPRWESVMWIFGTPCTSPSFTGLTAPSTGSGETWRGLKTPVLPQALKQNRKSELCHSPRASPALRAERLLMLQPREHLPSPQPWTLSKCSVMEKETFLKYHLMSRNGSRARENMFIYYYADFNAKDWFSD